MRQHRNLLTCKARFSGINKFACYEKRKALRKRGVFHLNWLAFPELTQSPRLSREETKERKRNWPSFLKGEPSSMLHFLSENSFDLLCDVVTYQTFYIKDYLLPESFATLAYPLRPRDCVPKKETIVSLQRHQ
jgi:hypothetical protein